MSSVAVLAIFRNESHILEEFITHHLLLGITKFYLINNASTDNFMPIIGKYAEHIELFYEPKVTNVDTLTEKGIQTVAYNKYLKKIVEPWALICDVDEFFYTRRGYSFDDVVDYLERNNLSQLLIFLRNFASGGIIKQPKEVRKSFTKRAITTPSLRGITKALVRVKDVVQAHITMCKVKEGCLTTDSTLTMREYSFCRKDFADVRSPWNNKLRDVDEEYQKDTFILCNHYTSQSKEWFFSVKAKRGIVYAASTPLDDINKFWQERWDRIEKQPQVEDTELIEWMDKYGCTN